MDLILFQGHRFVGNMIFFFFFLKIHACCSLNNVWLLHTLKTSCTIIFVWFICVLKGYSLNIFGCLSVQVSQNSSAIFFDTMHIINVKLCMMVLVIKVYLFIQFFFFNFFFFNDIGYILRSRQCHKVFSENYFIVRLSWTFEWLLTMSTRIFVCRCLWLSYPFKGNNWHVSWFDKNFNIAAFSWTLFERNLSNIA